MLAKIIVHGPIARAGADAISRPRWPARASMASRPTSNTCAQIMRSPGFPARAGHPPVSCRTFQYPAAHGRGARGRHADDRAGLSRAASATGTSACRPPGPMDDAGLPPRQPPAWAIPKTAAGLEITLHRPDAAFRRRAVICLTGAPHARRRSMAPRVAMLAADAPSQRGQTARASARIERAGRALISPCGAASTCRTISAAAPPSRSASFGGHAGRALRAAMC